MNDVTVKTETDGFIKTIKELLHKNHHEWSSIIPTGIFCLLFSLVSFWTPNVVLNQVFDNLIGVFSDLLGFMIATIAIIYSFSEDTVSNLLRKAADNKKPYHVLLSTFTLVCIWMLFTIFSLLVTLAIEDLFNCIVFKIASCVCIFESLMTFLGVLHTIIHLYSIRTFFDARIETINNNNNN